MSIAIVSRERHGNRAWNKAADFAWMRQELLAFVTLQEATQLMMSFPLAFTLRDERLELIALFGLSAGDNVWVADDGRWLASRMPAALRHYPFRLVHTTDGKDMLGIDENGLLPPDAIGGIPLFDADGKATPEINALVEQLSRAAAEHAQTRKAIELLQQFNLIEPWPIQVQEAEGVRTVDGLHRVNEKQLNQVSSETMGTLHSANALLLCYMQLLSMHHLQQLGAMAGAREAARRQAEANPSNQHGIISFANL